MATTIQISEQLKQDLLKRRVFERETYEDIIKSIMEDNDDISEDLIKRLERSRKQIDEGKTHSFDEIKKKHNLNR